MDATRAPSERCSGVSFLARARPPFAAPSFPSSTACGFFLFSIQPSYNRKNGGLPTSPTLAIRPQSQKNRALVPRNWLPLRGLYPRLRFLLNRVLLQLSPSPFHCLDMLFAE